MSITLTDYIDGEFSVIINRDIQNRIDELENLASDDLTDDDDHDELNALLRFQDEITKRLDTHFDDVTIVPDDELAEHLQAEAEANDDVSQHLSGYVNWGAVAADSRGDYVTVVFNGDEHYLVRV